jgi:hypothetical protein
MALVNPSIALGVQPLQIADPLTQYGKIAAIKSAQNQNALAQYQLNAAQRADAASAVQNELMAKHFDPSKGAVNLNALIAEAAQRGQGGIIPSLLKTDLERQTAAATLAKTKAETEKNIYELQDKKLRFAWNAVGSAPTPEAAIAELTKGVKDGIFDMRSATEEIQRVRSLNPDQYRQYRIEKVMGILDAKDKLGFMLPKVTRQEAGGQILSIQDNPMLPGYGQPIAGAAITKTPTIAERTAQGQLAVAKQRLAQEAQGVTYQQDAQGNLVALPSRLPTGKVPVARPVTGEGGAPVKGKLSAFAEKTAAQRTQMGKDLDFAIRELSDITEDGGLIDQSTGSGAGRLVDVGARFFGQATPGDIAIGKIAPVADLALKMIPRFEGPQSDKDTASYKEAAGQLADPTLPTKVRKEAGKTVLRLMRERKNQFATSDMVAEGGDAKTSNLEQERANANAAIAEGAPAAAVRQRFKEKTGQEL